MASGGAPVAIPLVDLAAQIRTIRPELDAAIGRVLDHGQFVLGREVVAFEEDLARWIGCAEVIGVSSGTAALKLALEACGVSAGDEVVVPALTFVATAEAVRQLGAIPRFADVDPRTGALDPDAAAERCGPRTRALIPVHLWGRPVELEPLVALAARHGAAIVEDAAQAHGARADGRHVGTRGRAGALSFYPGKNLGAFGDAGAVVTGDAELAAHVRALRDHGRSPGDKHAHRLPAGNERLDAIQAAVLRTKLAHLERWVARRRALAGRYHEAFADLAHEPPGLELPDPHGGHAWHLYVVRCDERDALARHLAEAGIATGLHYPVPLHRQPCFADLADQRPLPASERLARRVLSLPLYPELGEADQERVIATVRGFFEATRRR